MANACANDGACRRSGCSGEICAADEIMSTCEVMVQVPASASCGCVAGQCAWFTTDGSRLPAATPTQPNQPAPQPPTETPGTACGDRTCNPGQDCITYFGVAGPAGPKFYACEIRCKQGQANDGCPTGTRCNVIADGPGPVCR